MDQYLNALTNPFLIGALVALGLFWLIVLVQTWLDQDSGIVAKILWTIGQIFIWPIATPLYALIKYRGIAKLIPVIIVGGAFFAYASLANTTNDMIFYAANQFVEQRVKHQQLKNFVTERLDIMDSERGAQQRSTNFMIANFLILLIDDDNGLTAPELKQWTQIYNKRHELRPEQVQAIMLELQQKRQK